MMRRRDCGETLAVPGEEGIQHVPVLGMQGSPFGVRDLRHRATRFGQIPGRLQHSEQALGASRRRSAR